MASINQECIFCKIIAGAIPGSFVYTDDQIVAFLSLDQPNEFKVLVCPRKHIANIYGIDDILAGYLMRGIVNISRSIKNVSGCTGLNIIQSNDKAGQQDVFHLHFHLLPRLDNDKVVLNWNTKAVDRDSLDRMSSLLRNYIKNCM